MPRIKITDVLTFGERANIIGQDPASLSRAFEITSDLNADLLRAVGADYADSIPDDSEDIRSSDVWQAWNNGYGVVAAGILHGATECAHVSAVQWAHAFNGTLGEGFACWNRDGFAPFDEWRSYCLKHVTVCASCETHNFDADPESLCGNCLAPMTDGHPLGVEQDEFDDLVYGYVTAATWSSLEYEPERDADGLATFKVGTEHGTVEVQAETEEDATARVRASHAPDSVSIEWVEVERPESGSDPHEFGPDDLDTDVLREIRQECADYVRANLADLKAYAEIQGTTVDHPQAAGGGQLPEHESSAFETAGYEIYVDGAGTGVGFWTRDLGELGDRLSAATKGMSSEHLGLWLNSEDGRIYR